jgi:hypothetical protein
MHRKLLLILFFSIPLIGFLLDEPVITTDELNILTGKKWTGKLTYLDYSSKELVSIPAEVTVLNTQDPDAFIFIKEYPDEPKANSTDTVRIEENGKKFDNETVTEKISDGESSLKIVTEAEGMDDEKTALIRHTYFISNTKYTIQKDVNFGDGNNFLKRHIYEFERTD